VSKLQAEGRFVFANAVNSSEIVRTLSQHPHSLHLAKLPKSNRVKASKVNNVLSRKEETLAILKDGSDENAKRRVKFEDKVINSFRK